MKSIVILGPTACGKTKLAVQLSLHLDGEIISADSRQVYKKLNIGTGKDLDNFIVNGKKVPYHMIDIVEPESFYNLHQYQIDFQVVYDEVLDKKKLPIIVGGSGLYLEAILHDFTFSHIPINQKLRDGLEIMNISQLDEILKNVNQHFFKFDTTTQKRLIRAIEICEWINANNIPIEKSKPFDAFLIGIRLSKEELRNRIKERLKTRLENGMIDEVKGLMESGISKERLLYFGLEYKYIVLYLEKELNYRDMYEKLNVAIRQFAKRQMTWFRRMEKRGLKIKWIDGSEPTELQCATILKILNESRY